MKNVIAIFCTVSFFPILALGFVLGGCLLENDVDSHVGEIAKIKIEYDWDPVGGDDLDGYHVTFRDKHEVHIEPYVFQDTEDELALNKKYVGQHGRFIKGAYGFVHWKVVTKLKPEQEFVKPNYHSWE